MIPKLWDSSGLPAPFFHDFLSLLFSLSQR